jgi:phosphatidylserine decarboxylase
MRLFLIKMTMPTMNLQTIIQYLAPQHALSAFAGWLSECRWRWFKNWQINHLVKRYHVDLNEAESSNIDDYPTFNSFFTRRLKPGIRPLPQDPTIIVSPADGCISQLGFINQDSLFQAKGFHFSLATLLGHADIAKQFENGRFATIYLSPKDYHRVHMPFNGKLVQTIYIPGKLFSVNQHTAQTVPNLFARNERLVCIFETKLGSMAVILVGAMLVGSINTVWNKKPYKSNSIAITHINTSEQINLARGEELGHFKMGSTAIVLFPNNAMDWVSSITETTTLRMGEMLGKTIAS